MARRRYGDEPPRVKGVTDPAERESLLQLLREQWPGESEWFRGEMEEPTFRWEQARILKVGDRVVGHAGVVAPRTMRYGVARLPVGGLHAVVVHPEWRRKGYGQLLVEDAMAMLRGLRLTASILYTAQPDFYRRWGYEVTLPFYSSVISAEQAARADVTPGPTRTLRAEDLSAVAAVYERDNATRTGTFVRDRAYWQWQLEVLGGPQPRLGKAFYGSDRELLVMDSPRGPTAYAWIGRHADRMWAFEVGIRPEREAGRFARSLLAALGARAMVLGLTEIILICPPEHPVAQVAYELGGSHVVRRGAGMMCALDLASMLQAALPELNRRLTVSPRAEWRGALRIEVDGVAVALLCDRGQVDLAAGEMAVAAAREVNAALCRMPAGTFVRLFMGTCDAHQLPSEPGVELRGVDLHALAALFPLGHPHLWPADNHF